jgi:hypothetical protein
MGFLLQCTKFKKILIAGLEIMRAIAIARRGKHKWDFNCSVHLKKKKK